MIIHLYQYIGILIGIVALIFTIIRFRDGKLSLGMFALWSGVWFIVILISIFPDVTSTLAIFTGIGRGLDVILIIGLIGCYYLIFRIYNMIENIEEEINQLVREIALERGSPQESSSEDQD
ncbi:MAG: DUF2304 family protein [Methanobacteriaceae archaeon]